MKFESLYMPISQTSRRVSQKYFLNFSKLDLALAASKHDL